MKKTIISAIVLATATLAGAQETVRTLVVTDKEGKTTEFVADQVAGIIFDDMPEYTALTNLLNLGYEETAEAGSYLLEFGTDEPDATGSPSAVGGMQIALLMRAPKSQDLSEPALPAGYYTAGNNSANYTFDITRSALYVRLEEGEEGVAPQMIVTGTVDVRPEAAGDYDIRMELTTMAGSVVNLRYQGPLPFPAGVSDYTPFTENVDLTFTNGQGRFYGNWYYPFAADLNAQFFVGTISNGTLTDGYILDIPLFEPKPADCMAPSQRIADGTYTVETREKIEYTYLPYRFTPGKHTDFMGQVYMTGAHLTYLSPDGHRKYGFLTGGTMTVSDNGTKFVFDFTTPEGVSIKGTYNGIPIIQNYCDNDEKEPKRPYSTLTEDVVLNWDPATVCISYNNRNTILENANDFMVMFTTPDMDKGDYVLVELFAEGDELPDGTYTIDSTLEAGHGIPGAIDFAGQMLFSWYGDLGLVDEEGYNTKLGPVAAGSVTVSTLNDGQRKFVFDMTDDNGHKITGEYTGQVVNSDINDAAPARNMFKTKERKVRRIPPRAPRR